MLMAKTGNDILLATLLKSKHFFNLFVLHGSKALLNQAHDIKSPETNFPPV